MTDLARQNAALREALALCKSVLESPFDPQGRKRAISACIACLAAVPPASEEEGEHAELAALRLQLAHVATAAGVPNDEHIADAVLDKLDVAALRLARVTEDTRLLKALVENGWALAQKSDGTWNVWSSGDDRATLLAWDEESYRAALRAAIEKEKRGWQAAHVQAVDGGGCGVKCPACGKNLKSGELTKHVEECRDLQGSGTLSSELEPLECGKGPTLGESHGKPSLDYYDRI